MEDSNGADGAGFGVGEPAAGEEIEDGTSKELGGKAKSFTRLG